MSLEYHEDDMYAKTTPGHGHAGRGQRRLHKAFRTTDPWHHDIDEDDDDDIVVIIDRGGKGGGKEGGYEGGNDPDDTYGGYYNSGAALAGDEDFSDDEEIGRRRPRIGRRRLGRRRGRRAVGSGNKAALRSEQTKNKKLEAKRRALKKESRQGKKSGKRDERRKAREVRRQARLDRLVKKERKRGERLKKEIAKLEGDKSGTSPDILAETVPETVPDDSNFTEAVHNLRYSGDVLCAEAGSAVFSVKGTLTSGKSIYDTAIGRAFFHRILEHDDEDFFGSREESLDFVSEHFGLDFEGAKEDKHTGALTLLSGDKTVAMMEPFTINTDLETGVESIKGFGDDANTGAVVHEGGWRTTLHVDATLHGLYGGEEGKLAAKGDAIFYYETHVQDEDSEVPVVFHFETHAPVSMKPSGGKIQTELAVQYVDLLHPDPDTFDGIADRTIRLKEIGVNSCDINISTNVHF